MIMSTPLLTTKLYIPPPRPGLVQRQRLLQALDEGLGLGHRLTVVSAPAGFGKTTLVTEWLYSGYPHISPLSVAWLSLDEGDNDPVRFLNYVIAALRQVESRIGQTVHDLLGAPQPPPVESLVTLLVNDVTTVSDPFVLVLDDYQLVRTPEVHDALTFLLEHIPPPMHLVLLTREDPDLPIARLRARGQVTEIGQRDLRFTAEEAADFFEQTMGLRLQFPAVQILESRTEGWITGLQLAALALQEERGGIAPGRERRGDTQAFAAAFTGDDRFVMDYLLAEVLERQPEAVRDFLQRTAILERLTAPLCDAVQFGDAESPSSSRGIAPTGRSDSQALLEQLDGANLFLTPLDHRREWYRYHRLFAEALRARLDKEEQQCLHRRAMGWYEKHGPLNEAIRHALAAAAWDDAQRLIVLAAEDTLHAGGLLTLRHWLDALPEARVQTNARLATYLGWTLVLSGEMAQGEACAAQAQDILDRTAIGEDEQGIASDDRGAILGQLLVLRSFVEVFGQGDYATAAELTTRALQVLGPDMVRWRVIALWTLAECQERTVIITQAIATLREAQRERLSGGSQVFAVTVDAFLATALQAHGERQAAIAVCEEALSWCTDEAGRQSPVAGLVYSLLGALYYESSELALARQYVDQGTALSEELGLEGSLTFSYGLAAATLHAQGDTGLAQELLQRAHQIAASTGLVEPDVFLARQANIHLQQGNLPAVVRWAEAAGLSPNDKPDYLGIEPHLVYGRLLLAQGRVADAYRLLARWEVFAEERGLRRLLISIRVLRALAAERLGERRTALDALGQALEMAAPETFVRAFLDEGSEVLDLLPRARQAAPAFVDQLLAEAGTTGTAPGPQPLLEPLSHREMEVLGLIAAGLTNREIAERLFIALGTVKRHINNIYGKLQARHRTEAVARARDLGLL
jgi:LuxR family maltose regulon positive regulatory protein